MKTINLMLRQAVYVNKAFWRNPASAFFTFAFPIMFLIIFNALLGNHFVRIGDKRAHYSTYYVSAMATFGLISACYTNIAISISYARDEGLLKRISGTPLPKISYIGARVLHALFVAALLVVITALFGRFFYQAELPSGITLLRFIVALVVGAVSFSALGFAITARVRDADASPAVVNASIFPLLFLSGIFIPLGNNAPSWIHWVARVFPVWHFALSMQAGFIGTSYDWTDVLIVAAWGIFGLLASVKYFRWEPAR
ncbi:MAG: ABC transporter permease [Firmicutes bacterium]|jgi:ABC-2 type transport system permease protein|nr:ABC transporter permease [Bacillota bacterium]